ncbi:MAG: hypothetical protein FJ263_00635 [Planctomycetes bacterium]|nr:hypothetical protein [Planctomycetota bacterium]
MSVRTNKSGVVWAGILICVCCAGVAWAEEKSAPPPDPYANVQILVEAFVVEVPTSAMAEIGISPIGQGSDGITVAKLGACLVSDEGAQVISGMKVAVRQRSGATAKEQKTSYYKHIKKIVAMSNNVPVTSTSIQHSAYDFGKSLRALTSFQPDCSIRVEYEYNESGVTPDVEHYDPNDETPPSRYGYNWEGVLSLASGEPTIAGATQNKDSVIFLILTATAQNMPEVKQAEPDTAVPSN